MTRVTDKALAMMNFATGVIIYHQNHVMAAVCAAVGVWCAIDAIRAK